MGTGAGIAGPGTELISLAFELGYPQVLTRDSKVVRVDPDQAAMLEAQVLRLHACA